ncbi:MAG: T9SS type A sorting domain-containing protein, partial [Bacteroidia bacterium]|nr:T9SS type A sorting domain-containing protein [Bacteroidia bacterium]
EILGSNPYELFWMDTFDISEDVRILDNYYSNEELLPLLEKTTTLAIDQNTGKYYANERGWKEITYKVTDPSGNVSKKVKRIVSVDFRSGIIEVSNANELTIYPNPSNGKFTIQSKEVLNGATEISLYNILGAKVYSTSTEIKGTSIDINTQGLKAGIYLVQINNNGTIHTERITIK